MNLKYCNYHKNVIGNLIIDCTGFNQLDKLHFYDNYNTLNSIKFINTEHICRYLDFNIIGSIHENIEIDLNFENLLELKIYINSLKMVKLPDLIYLFCTYKDVIFPESLQYLELDYDLYVMKEEIILPVNLKYLVLSKYTYKQILKNLLFNGNPIILLKHGDNKPTKYINYDKKLHNYKKLLGNNMKSSQACNF